jgi:isopentenyldiphosphate isomerase
MSEEYFDVVDGSDVVTGRRPRSEVHRLNLNHRAVHVLVYNQRGELFLQQRSLAKDCSPGLWDSSASGHVTSGDEYDETAPREVEEELGVTLSKPPERWFKLSASEGTANEFCWIYRAAHEGPFVLQPSEVRGGGWFTHAAIEDWVQRRPSDFAGAFLEIWQHMRQLGA